jgi:hypothetical protein
MGYFCNEFMNLVLQIANKDFKTTFFPKPDKSSATHF